MTELFNFEPFSITLPNDNLMISNSCQIFVNIFPDQINQTNIYWDQNPSHFVNFDMFSVKTNVGTYWLQQVTLNYAYTSKHQPTQFLNF